MINLAKEAVTRRALSQTCTDVGDAVNISSTGVS
jgi:hypothetical protein